jgi:hypothetical protein
MGELEAWLSQGNSPMVALALENSPAYDAFGRIRTSQPVTLFDSQLQYDDQPLLWFGEVSGSATIVHSQPGASERMSVSANGVAVRTSKAYLRYQPGKSQLVMMTFVAGTTGQNVTRKVGYFDNFDGIYFQVVGTAMSFVLRSSQGGSPVETIVPQAQWNLDRLDGGDDEFNLSSLNLDATKAQILFIDLEWLGVGRVRVGFVIDGIVYPCHEFTHANKGTGVYMSTANLPVRYEILGGAGVTGTHVLDQICATVVSEGGFEEEYGFPFSAGNGTTVIPVTTRRPVLSIRPAATFGGKVNRSGLVPEEVSFYTSAQSIYWELVYGGVLTSGSFAAVDAQSAVEVDKGATAIAGGVVIDSGYLDAGGGLLPASRSNAGAGRILSKLPLRLTPAGAHPTGTPSDNLTLVATSIPGSATNVAGALNWRETR